MAENRLGDLLARIGNGEDLSAAELSQVRLLANALQNLIGLASKIDPLTGRITGELTSGTTILGTEGLSGPIVFNEAGDDADLRIEGDTATNLVLCDAGLNAFQVGTTTAGAIADFRAATIALNDAGADLDITMEGDTATNLLKLDAGLDAVQIGTTTAGAIADFRAATIVFNEASNDVDFRVESNGNANMFVVDGGLDAAGIGTATPRTPNGLSVSLLDLHRDVSGAIGPILSLTNDSGNANAGGAIDFYTYTTTYPGVRIQSLDDGNYGAHLIFKTKPSGADAVATIERLRISDAGLVTLSGDLLVDGTNIGITADADLVTMAADTFTVSGTVAASTVTGANVTSGADPGHTHTGASLSVIDISADTNLTATSGVVLTGDQLTHDTADPYKHTPTAGASTQLLQYTAAGTAKWITVSGDATIADGGAVTIDHGGLDGLTDDDHTQYLKEQPAADEVWNETGADFDLRFEGDTDANLLYLDAGNNRVGIGTATPGGIFETKLATNSRFVLFDATAGFGFAGPLLDALNDAGGLVPMVYNASTHIFWTGSVVVGTALATNATDGFLYIPTCPGAPTGTPTAYTGRAAIVYDSTNDAIYVYDGAWLHVHVAA